MEKMNGQGKQKSRALTFCFLPIIQSMLIFILACPIYGIARGTHLYETESGDIYGSTLNYNIATCLLTTFSPLYLKEGANIKYKRAQIFLDGLWYESALFKLYNSNARSNVSLGKRVLIKGLMNTMLITKVSGRIVDEKGNVLESVTIIEKGTKNGTVSDSAGRFSLDVKDASSVLLVSSIGYETKEVNVSDLHDGTIVLKSADQKIDEVIVVGYGGIRKKDLSGSVATLSAKEFQNTPVPRVDQALQGRIAGLQVTSTSGEPGSDMKLRIRGVGSLQGSSDPLIVVDGIIGGINLNSINPQDIKDIQVLKDASSTAIYGSRGANGVILITTKRGVGSNGDNITLNWTQGWSTLPKDIPMLQGYDFVDAVNESRVRGGTWPLYMDYDTISNTNWQRKVTRVAPQTNLNFSLSGGRDKINYLINASYRDEQGIILGTGFKRAQLRVNLDKKIGKRVKLMTDFNLSHTVRKLNDLTFGGENYASALLAYPPNVPVYDSNGNYAAFINKTAGGTYPSLLAIAALTDKQQRELGITGRIGVDINIIDDLLSFSSSISTVYNAYNYHDFQPAQLDLINNRANLTENMSNNYNLIFTNYFTFTPKFGVDDSHSITATIGGEYQKSNTLMNINTSLSGIDNRTGPYNLSNYSYIINGAVNRPGISGGLGDNPFTIVSGVARVVYSYKDKYILTGTGRADGASPFGAENKYAFFPAVSAAWNISNEAFLKDNEIISNLKLRASYGSVGNSALAPYSTLALVSGGPAAIFGTTQSASPSFYLNQLANPALKWEKSDQVDIGLEVGLFKGRVDLEVDYYNRNTNNLLFSVPVAYMSGFKSYLTNIGKINNRGIELLINGTIVSGKRFSWNTAFNISRNVNKVIELGGGADNVPVTKYGYGVKPMVILKKGEALGSFWGLKTNGIFHSWDEVNQELQQTQYRTGGLQPRPGGIRYVDQNGDNIIDDNDYMITGNPNPKFFGGITNDFHYKNIGLKVFLKYSSGNSILNWGYPFYGYGGAFNNSYGFNKDRWREDRPEADVFRIDSRDYIPNDTWIADGSYLKIGEVTLTYDVPVSKIGGQFSKIVKGLHFNATCYNLYSFNKYKYGFDPDVTGFTGGYQSFGSDNVLIGIDSGIYPLNRTFTIGCRIDF